MMTNLLQKHFAVLGAGNIGKILLDRLLWAGVPNVIWLFMILTKDVPERRLKIMAFEKVMQGSAH